MEDRDPAVRARATRDWLTWEDAVVSLEPAGKRSFCRDQTSAAALAFVRICAHYATHGTWLAEGELLAGAGNLAGIPGVLIHGRLDLSCRLDTAGELARAWPSAELITIANRGHQGNPGERDAYLAALDRFAHR